MCDTSPSGPPPAPQSAAQVRRGFWGRRGMGERPKINWLWQGYLAPGQVTLLTALWKSGKTTLLSILLSRLKAGGQLAELPVAPVKAVVVSEESDDQWRARIDKLELDHVYFICRRSPESRLWSTGWRCWTRWLCWAARRASAWSPSTRSPA